MSDQRTTNWKSGGAFGTHDEEQQTGEIYGERGADPRRGPLSEPQGYTGGYAGARPTPFSREDDDFYADEEGGILDLLRDRWHFVLGTLVVLVVLFVVAGWVFGGGDPPAAPESSKQQAPSAEKAQGAQKEASGAAGKVEDTGVAVEPGTQGKDGTVILTAGDLAWKGKVEKTNEGEVLTLEGPTAAQFKRGFELPNGSVTSGVFAVAQPGKSVVHATFHRAEQGEEEVTTGTYYAMDENVVLSQGTYVDERDGDTITRTYTERPAETEENVYRVAFTAPKDAPIPFLPGWKAPPGADASGAISGSG